LPNDLGETWPEMRKRRGIGRRLLVRMLLFGSAATLILTAVQLYVAYRYGVSRGLLDEALIVLASQAAMALLVSLFTLFVFHRQVTRHLIDAWHDLQAANAALERDIAVRIESETAMREAEQRYRQLFHTMPVALLQMRGNFDVYRTLHADGITDLGAWLEQHPHVAANLVADLTVEQVNDRAVELFRASDASQLSGLAEHFWKESPDVLRRLLESRFRGEARFDEEMKVVAMDGQVIDVLCTVSRLVPITDTSPTVFGLVDITDRVRARDELQQLEADLAHAARISILGELTASIAHEINQPLAAIATCSKAMLNWLNRSEPDIDEARRLAQYILKDVHRAGDIIVRTRAMATKSKPKREALSLDEVIDESLLFLRHEIQVNAVAVRHRVNAGTLTVLGDRTQLQQVIVNLTVNAIQAMARTAERRAQLGIDVTADFAGTLRCVIEDSGPGIDAIHLPSLFTTFFTTIEGEMGMGLAICRTIVESHGGSIGADNDSSLGGARFFFTLPVAAPSA
jgi:C4-dicarboxylate-specific signal transduction histidine kinase